MNKNPNCPVSGCRAKVPHTNDPMVKILMALPPQELAMLTVEALTELRASVQSDHLAGRTYAWMARLRQPDELYMRCIYALLLAPNEELPHIFSGDTPNGFDFIYSRFNEDVLEGRGELQETKPGLTFGNFTPIKTIHNATHGSFQSLMTWKGSRLHPQYVAGYPERFIKHIQTYCTYLDHVGRLFAAGRTKDVALTALRNMHTSLPKGE